MNSKTIKIKIKMIEMGIAPALSGKELNEMFSSMSEDERRTSKRKFRKVWRRLLKDNRDWEDILVSEKSSHPDEVQLRNRACFVTSKIIDKIKTN